MTISAVRPTIQELGRVLVSVQGKEIEIDGISKWEPLTYKREKREFMDFANYPIKGYLGGWSDIESASFSVLWHGTNPKQRFLVALARQQNARAVWKIKQTGALMASGNNFRVSAAGLATFGTEVKPPDAVEAYTPVPGDMIKAPLAANSKFYYVESVNPANKQLTLKRLNGSAPAAITTDTPFEFRVPEVLIQFPGFIGDASVGMGKGDGVQEDDYTIEATGLVDQFVENEKFDHDLYFKNYLAGLP